MLILVDILLVGGIDFSFVYSNAIMVFNSPSSVLQTAVLIIYLAVGLIIGYMIKAFAMEAAGFIESCVLSLCLLKRHYRALGRLYPHLNRQKSFLRRFSYIRRRCIFPYPIIHERKAYYKQLYHIIKQHSDFAVKDLPISKGPFSYCKRLIKVSSPELWEESIQLEAEVRMLGSLFLASFTSLFIALVAAQISQKFIFLKIAFIALSLSILLGIAFSRRRRNEARYTYLNTLLIGGKQKQALSQKATV